MFGIGANELFLILLFGFLIFGPDKLPALAKTIGQAISKFKNAQEEMNHVIKTEVYDPASSDEPFKNPLDVLSKVEDAGKKGAQKTGTPEKKESFTERKAKYDKERAERIKNESASHTAGQASGKDKNAPVPTADDLYGVTTHSTSTSSTGKAASSKETKDPAPVSKPHTSTAKGKPSGRKVNSPVLSSTPAHDAAVAGFAAADARREAARSKTSKGSKTSGSHATTASKTSGNQSKPTSRKASGAKTSSAKKSSTRTKASTTKKSSSRAKTSSTHTKASDSRSTNSGAHTSSKSTKKGE